MTDAASAAATEKVRARSVARIRRTAARTRPGTRRRFTEPRSEANTVVEAAACGQFPARYLSASVRHYVPRIRHNSRPHRDPGDAAAPGIASATAARTRDPYFSAE